MENTTQIVIAVRGISFTVVPVFGGVLADVGGVVVETVAPDRHYIGIGQPGFNSPANNRRGYKTASAARRASLGYASRGSRDEKWILQ